MDDSANPYASPQPLDTVVAAGAVEPRALNLRLMTAWAAVMLANVIVPAALALFATEERGKLGMIAAMLVVLVCGWGFCYLFPVLGRKLIAGSVLTALSQILPIVQVVAGIVGLGIASATGLFIEGNDELPDHFTGELGGFLATMITGSILVVGSFVLGWLVAFLLPKHWFYSSPIDNQPTGQQASAST